jgi:tetratricopeptide (TPR) repeat protein
MRFFLIYLSSVSKPALLIGAGVLLAYTVPAYAQQEDILLPAEDATALEDTPPPTLPAPDPAALTAPVDPSAAEQAQDSMDDLLKKIDAGADEVKQAPPAVPEVEAEQSIAAPPADAALASPDEAPAQSPTDAGAPVVDAAPDATNIPEIPALPAAAQADENLFFDADNLVPEGEMGTKGGPRKVNPSLQPASKLIVVTKDYTPNARQAQLVSAERAITLGRYGAALELYNGMYEKNKRDPNILMGRAIALQHLGQTDEAIQAYEELLDIRPENVQAQVNMLGLMGQRYPAVGLQRLMDLREKEPGNVALVGQIAVLQGGMGNYEEALKYLGIAASMEPHNANHLFNMAVIADRLGRKADAVNYYEQALEIDTIYGGGRSIPRESVYERLSRLR